MRVTPGAISMVLVLLGALLSGCTHDAERGADATQTGGPRIVVLSPAIAVMLRDLGLGDHLVGRHGFDQWSDQSLPVCGDQAGQNLEALLAARPTHVLIEGGRTGVPDSLARLGEKHGWVVRSWRLLTLDEVRGCVEDLCVLFPETKRETGDAHSRCDRLLMDFDLALSPRAGLAAAGPRTLLLMQTDPPTILGPGSFHQQILERIGVRPALEEGGPYMVVSAEDIVAIDPEAVILFRPVGPDGQRATTPITGRRVLGDLAVLDFSAAKSGRAALVDDPLGLTPGTNLARLADEIAAVLLAWQGADEAARESAGAPAEPPP